MLGLYGGYSGSILRLYRGSSGTILGVYRGYSRAMNIRCRIIIGIQQGTTILTTTHVRIYGVSQS